MHRRILRVYDGASDAVRQAGAAWYPQCRADVSATYRRARAADLLPDDERVVYAFAALSPRVTYAQNHVMLEALLSSGRVPGLSANVDAAVRALDGDPPRGRKTLAFAHAILGDEDAVVLDTWALRVAGAPPSPSERVFQSVAGAYRRAARARGVAPRTMQAATWVAARGAAW